MDSSQRALQTSGKLFFKFVFELLAKNRKIFKPIDQSAMCYTSMDLSRQALQTIGKLSSILLCIPLLRGCI